MSRLLDLSIFETEQRAENGGSPLSNEAAKDLGARHGTPVLILPKRKLIAFLKYIRRSVTIAARLAEGEEKTEAKECVRHLEGLIKKYDHFIIATDDKDIFKE